MGATIVLLETRAQWEERFRCALMAAYEAHRAGETSARLDALVQVLNRLVAFQMRALQAQQWRKKLP